MPFIGNQPAKVPLTSADITDGIIVNADINANAAIASSKLSITSPLSITGNSTAGSEIRLPEDTDNGSNYVALKAADNIASNLTFTLPSADGSANQALITNGSGSLSFATVGAAAGQVIQVVTATDSTERTGDSTSFITGSNTLSATITPSSTSNKIFAICSFNCGIDVNSDGRDMIFTIFRGATDIGASSSQGMSSIRANLNGASQYYIVQPVCISVLDSPSTTSATTYQLYYRRTDNNFNITLNKGSRKGSMTLFEIKG